MVSRQRDRNKEICLRTRGETQRRKKSEKLQSTVKQMLVWKGVMAGTPDLGYLCQPGSKPI